MMNKLDLSQKRLKNKRVVQMKDRPSPPDKPNQIWEMDLTKTKLILVAMAGFILWLLSFLSIAQLLAMRSIIDPKTKRRLSAFDKAVKNRFPEGTRDQGLILQVDNGCQPER